MNKQTIISTIRKEINHIPTHKLANIMNYLLLDSTSKKFLNKVALSRLEEFLTDIRKTKEDTDPRPCPWCKKDTKVYLEGSYVNGWISFVCCSNINCGARGPTKRTRGMSNDEYETEDKAIKSWNEVVGFTPAEG